jgi:putative two-component system response regulator
VVAFPSGALALKAATVEPPDIILLDIMMPDMNGYEICRLLKLHKPLNEVPVIFISALSNPMDKVSAFTCGGVDYITKPFQQEEVVSRVRTHLQLRAMQRTLERQNEYLEELVQQKVQEIIGTQLAVVFALSKLTEARDYETGRHVEHVRVFCRELSNELRKNPGYSDIITKDFLQNIYCASPLHDIGKVGIPDEILLKNGKLTSQEFEIMKKHSEIGANMLEMIQKEHPGNSFVIMGIEITRHHHEKWDGAGYPDGLKGHEIPLSARIMALVDAYDAMRSKRPYKQPYSHERTCKNIMQDSGTHFDPDVVDAFLRIESRFAEIHASMVDFPKMMV